MILQGKGGGSGSLCRVRIFISKLLGATMDAGLFIYFPREPGHNIYFKVLTESSVHPLTKKKGTSFKYSPIVPTAIHVLNTAMIHGLWPSIVLKI